MAGSKYGKYFLTEPIEIGPMLHICGEDVVSAPSSRAFLWKCSCFASAAGVMIHKRMP